MMEPSSSPAPKSTTPKPPKSSVMGGAVSEGKGAVERDEMDKTMASRVRFFFFLILNTKIHIRVQ